VHVVHPLPATLGRRTNPRIARILTVAQGMHVRPILVDPCVHLISTDVRIGGGPRIVRDFRAAGLVDHMHLVQGPTMLGRGVRVGDRLEALASPLPTEQPKPSSRPWKAAPSCYGGHGSVVL
jgi:riboflavin biosynthesis pyrimidine reductase